MGSKNFDENQWHQTTWGDIVELKYGKALKDYQNSQAEFPVYGTNGPVGFCNTALCPYPSVIVGRKGAYRGIHFSDTPFFVIDTAFYINPLININLKWAYYHLLTQDINGLDSGSAIPSTRREDFYALPVNIPPRWIQDEIVNKLDSFEKKITLNRQINQTLEQMAQTLFKSWFVDFDPVIDNALDAGNDIPDTLQERAEQRRLLRAKADFKSLPAATRALFPSEFEETELGWVPKGWDVLSIGDMCDAVTNGGTPNRATKEFWTDGEIPWYKTGEFADGFLLTPSERITHLAVANSSVKLLPENSVLMAIYAAPTVGRLGILTETSAFNQAATGMTPKSSIGTWFLFLTLYFARDWFNNRANGAAQQNISKAIVENYLTIVPNSGLLDLFNKQMESFFAKTRFNSEQIQRLSTLRDTLLPKLISGELALDDLPEDVAEAAEAV